MFKELLTLFQILAFINCEPEDINWRGKWFPHFPSESDNNPAVEKSSSHLQDPLHGIKMGIEDINCDNGKTNLQIDWLDDPVNFTCYENRNEYLPKFTVSALLSKETIPPAYSAPHKCMNESIDYNHYIPTFGTHRPLWAKWGEYTFLPKQRWIHNLEHGGLTMLYHPCAEKNEVEYLKKLVKDCLYRHIITPYNLLTRRRPMALVTWGHRMEISKVSPELVVNFIRKYALNGPEHTSRDGQYSLYLESHAEIITDQDDSNLCPNWGQIKD